MAKANQGTFLSRYSQEFVCHWELHVRRKFMETGEVTAKKQPHRELMRVLDHHHVLLVIGLVLNQPDLYLREVCQCIHATCI